MESIYVVATGQHVGKTTMSLGLVSLLEAQGYTVRFFKPVGQQYVMHEGHKIDKDALLLQAAFGVEGALTDMSPILAPRGFVPAFDFCNYVSKRVDSQYTS